MNRFKIGVVGCGRISNQYLTNLTEWFPATIELAACADLDPDTAKRVAEEFGAGRACTPDDVYADPEIDAVLNLTNPWAHTEVNLAALEAGKHVYAEKPFALTREDARKVTDTAKEKGLRFGCAPDTFLGAGIQTCIKLLDEGWIGRPLVARGSITMTTALSARYQSAGIGGVLMDMGPYYITALAAMFGPVKRLAGFTAVSSATRTISDMRRPDYGETFPVESPTTVAGTLEHDSGVFAHLTTTSDGHRYGPELSVVGTEGWLTCNDPNMFGGQVIVHRRGGEPMQMPLTHQYSDRNRGLGMVEMLFANEAGRPHRASAELAYHCLDVMLGLKESSESGAYHVLERACERPTPFVPGHVESPLL